MLRRFRQYAVLLLSKRNGDILHRIAASLQRLLEWSDSSLGWPKLTTAPTQAIAVCLIHRLSWALFFSMCFYAFQSCLLHPP